MKKFYVLLLSFFVITNVIGQGRATGHISGNIQKAEIVSASTFKSINEVFYQNDFQGADPFAQMVMENIDGNTDNPVITAIPLDFTAGYILLVLNTDTTNVWAGSNSYFATPAQADRWLITPAIAITDSAVLSWNAFSVIIQGTGTGESYEVYVTTTIAGAAPAHTDFTNAPVFTITTEGASPAWASHEVDLKALGFVNQTIYIAFRHTSNDEGVLGIDNILVERYTAPVIGQMEGDFEDVTDFSIDLSPWTNIDGDGLISYGFAGVTFPHMGEAMAFIAFNPATTTPALTGAAPHGGERYGASFAVADDSNTGLVNDDWLISPQVTIAVNGKITFWARTYDDQYGQLERFKVGVSTTTPTEAAMTIISPAPYVEADTAWTQYQYDLSAYAQQQVYVGINCVSVGYYTFIFMIDDIVIDTATIGLPEVNKNEITVYPNPASHVLNINNIRNSTVYVYNMLGEVVASIRDADTNNKINVSSFAEGTYMVKVFGNKDVFTKMINIIK
jgi:hypothetical protein